MATRRDIQRNERERVTLLVLGILKGGRTPYADALAEYERREGLRGGLAADVFAHLVQELIAEKLIDYEADPSARGPVPSIAALWLRPRGEARIREGGAQT